MPAKNVAPQVEDAPTMTLAEYCSALSVRDGRVEMISAFFNMTNGNGLARCTAAEFDAQFEKFCKAPA